MTLNDNDVKKLAEVLVLARKIKVGLAIGYKHHVDEKVKTRVYIA